MYKIYLTKQIDAITEDAEEMGAANDFEKACQIAQQFLNGNKIKSDKYWRFCGDIGITHPAPNHRVKNERYQHYSKSKGTVFIDFGSYCCFIAITNEER